MAASEEAAWPAAATTGAWRRKMALAFSLWRMMESRWSRDTALSLSDVSSPVAKACFLASSDQTRRACLPHPPHGASRLVALFEVLIPS